MLSLSANGFRIIVASRIQLVPLELSRIWSSLFWKKNLKNLLSISGLITRLLQQPSNQCRFFPDGLEFHLHFLGASGSWAVVGLRGIFFFLCGLLGFLVAAPPFPLSFPFLYYCYPMLRFLVLQATSHLFLFWQLSSNWCGTLSFFWSSDFLNFWNSPVMVLFWFASLALLEYIPAFLSPAPQKNSCLFHLFWWLL